MKNLLSLIFFAAAATAFGQCDTGTLKGAYSLALAGVGKGDAGQITAQFLGRVEFDGSGKFTLSGVSTLNNKSDADNDTGEYQVSAECGLTGKTTAGGGEIDGVVSNNGSDHVIILRVPGVTFSGGGSKIDGLASCSVASMNGGFGFAGQGPARVDDVPVTFTEVGVLTFDGKGGVSGNLVSSVVGNVLAREQMAGTYEIAATCLGTAKVKIAGNDVLLTFVPIVNGNGFSYQNVGPNGTITGSASKVTR